MEIRDIVFSDQHYKNLITSIKSLNLEQIDTTIIENFKQDSDSNKYLFKIIVYLSRCADKCTKEKLPYELHIYRLTFAVCKNLTEISDKITYLNALYFIVLYLLQGQYFVKAKSITEFMLDEKILDSELNKNFSFSQLAKIWQTELFKKLDTCLNKLSLEKAVINEEFISYVKFHLKILNYCDEKQLYTFVTVDSYVRKLAKIPLKISFTCLAVIFEHLSNYISKFEKNFIVEAYDMIVVIICFAFVQRSDVKNNNSILNYFTQCFDYFMKPFSKVTQCIDCYNLFKEYFVNLFETDLMIKEIGTVRFKKILNILKTLLDKYGEKNSSVVQTVSAISFTFEILFSNWENLVSSKLADTTITYDEIVEMGNFVKWIHNISLNRKFQPSYICKQCPESTKCLVKNDIFNSCIFTASFVKVITRANQETLEKKVFIIAKELLELLVSAFNELERLGCKYSSMLWGLCGKLIFNVGLISEVKYASHLEKLYKILCKQIVHHDGLQAHVSSFGLENPVGSSLHRLCNIYYNQEKYRQAMTYAAYNALLSNVEKRKHKACDMWANIKFKSKNSETISNLTILQCLETDVDVVKELGITVNINDYDLNDLSLKELKSLFVLKVDVLDAMKQILNLLESRNTIIEFAQGTLLLCFHALQLIKREYILDYILKAIDKLKNYKPKSVSILCLLANLNFFHILEKLYIRSQVIDKQMEDDTFTIKSFKSTQYNPAIADNADEQFIIPTYGGINIKEDNKLASEFNEVLSIWEKCISNDMNSLINGWEPKFTLETIIICGEFCRLYKFNIIEIKSWTLAYKLATSINDFQTCTYVTSRSLSLKCINDSWINVAKNYVESIKDFDKSAFTMEVAALFWLSLAEFNLHIGNVEEAKILLNKVKSIPNFNALGNNKLYIYLVNVIFQNFFTIYSKTSQEAYCQFIVEIHYLLINSYEVMTDGINRFWNVKYHLIECEQMFESLNNIVIPLNSILSYREVTLHLSTSLKIAQKFGTSLRVAELLKLFCYVDLLRSQIDSSEMHLQDLQHILCLSRSQSKFSLKENFNNNIVESLSRLTLSHEVQRTPKVVPISLSKNSASPELRKNQFFIPKFCEHSPFCQCFFCTNLEYLYLIFSYNHLQAQFFCTLKYVNEAERFFYEASKIKLKIEELDIDSTRKFQDYQWKPPKKYTFDCLLFLLDFNTFIVKFKPNKKNRALNLIDEAYKIATESNLNKYCVASYAIEIYIQHNVNELLLSNLSIYVPHDITINVTNKQLKNCTTPKVNIEKVTRNPRRRKSPPVIALPLITVSDTENEFKNNYGNSPLPSKSKSTNATKVLPVVSSKSKRTSARNVRRKLLADESDESSLSEEKEKVETISVKKKSLKKVTCGEENKNLTSKSKAITKTVTAKNTRKFLADKSENLELKDKVNEETKFEAKRSTRAVKKSN